MDLNKREFLQLMGAASVAGLSSPAHSLSDTGSGFYDLPAFGQVSLLHMTDCHAQLLPIHFREPSINLGLGFAKGKLPHLVGEQLLKACGVRAGSATAHALTHLDFESAAHRFGKVGGFAHLATLVKQIGRAHV